MIDGAKLDGKNQTNDNIHSPLYERGAVGRKIDKSTLKPINDPSCDHVWVDDDDEIGEMRSQKCAKCPVGRWVIKPDL